MGGGGAELLCPAVCIPYTGPALLRGMDQLLSDPFVQSPPHAWADSSQQQFLGCPVACSAPPAPISMSQLFCQVPSNPRISQEPGALKSSEVGYNILLVLGR